MQKELGGMKKPCTWGSAPFRCIRITSSPNGRNGAEILGELGRYLEIAKDLRTVLV